MGAARDGDLLGGGDSLSRLRSALLRRRDLGPRARGRLCHRLRRQPALIAPRWCGDYRGPAHGLVDRGPRERCSRPVRGHRLPARQLPGAYAPGASRALLAGVTASRVRPGATSSRRASSTSGAPVLRARRSGSSRGPAERRARPRCPRRRAPLRWSGRSAPSRAHGGRPCWAPNPAGSAWRLSFPCCPRSPGRRSASRRRR